MTRHLRYKHETWINKRIGNMWSFCIIVHYRKYITYKCVALSSHDHTACLLMSNGSESLEEETQSKWL